MNGTDTVSEMAWSPDNATDPFGVLELPAVFRLDAQTLHRAHINAVARASAGGAPAPDAIEAINRARDELGDPGRRAMAVLRRLGLAPGDAAKRALPAGFLEQMLARREEFEEAMARKDEAAADLLRRWAEQQRGAHLAAIEGVLDKPGPGAADAVAGELNALRYLDRMLEQGDEA